MRALLIALAISAPAFAAQQAARPAAEQLVRHMMPKEQYSAMIDQMSAQAMNSLRQKGKTPTDDEAQRFHAAMQEALPYDELVQLSARIYSQHFTDREIGDVLAFYKTPSGAKFTRELPAVMGDSTRETMKLIQARIPALLEKHGLTPKQEAQPAAVQQPAPAAPK